MEQQQAVSASDSVKSQAMQVLLLSDGIGGHVNQARGLLLWLQERYEISVTEVVVTLRFAPVAKLVLPSRVTNVAEPIVWFHRFYQSPPLPEAVPDIILSAGGKTSFANILLARHYGCQNIFLGSKRKLPGSAFSAHLTLEPSGDVNNLVMALTPSVVDPERLAAAAQSLRERLVLADRPLWALLVGGNGAGYVYQESDWSALARWANAVAEQEGIRWLITTSRRTDPQAERILSEHIQPDHLAYGAWWHRKEEKVVQAFMGLASAVVVTADSMTMITEAISSERPAVALALGNGRPDARYQAALAKFQAAGLCHLVALTDSDDDFSWLAGGLSSGADLSRLRDAFLDQLATLLALE